MPQDAPHRQDKTSAGNTGRPKATRSNGRSYGKDGLSMVDLSLSKSINTRHDRGPDRGPLPRIDHRETADNYSGELLRHGVYRIAVCRDGVQWLFQRQRPNFPPGERPGTRCVSKSGLTRLVRAYFGCDMPELDALPEHFQKRCRDEWGPVSQGQTVG